MIILIRDGRAELAEPDDFRRFSVDAGGATLAGVTAALSGSDAGRIEGEGAVISPAFLREEAGDTAGWEEGFAAMVEFAQTKGWVADDGGIRAHIENLG